MENIWAKIEVVVGKKEQDILRRQENDIECLLVREASGDTCHKVRESEAAKRD